MYTVNKRGNKKDRMLYILNIKSSKSDKIQAEEPLLLLTKGGLKGQYIQSLRSLVALRFECYQPLMIFIFIPYILV